MMLWGGVDFWQCLFVCFSLFVLFTTVLKYFPRMENSEAVKLHSSLSLTQVLE